MLNKNANTIHNIFIPTAIFFWFAKTSYTTQIKQAKAINHKIKLTIPILSPIKFLSTLV